MIIPALIDYYNSLEKDPDSDIAPLGFSRQLVSFEVVLSEGGESAEIRDARLPGDGKLLLRSIVVPGQSKPSGSGINPCLLWDNAQYMLAFKPDDPKPDRTRQAFEAFRNRHLALRKEIDDDAFAAVCRFLEQWSPRHAAELKEKAEFLTRFGVFRVGGEEGYVHDRPPVCDWWLAQLQQAGDTRELEAPSFASGRVRPIARLHEPKIKNVRDAQSSGATLVSFNQDAFESYGKAQGANSPLGLDEAFKYCTALNRLTSDDRRRVVIGDTTVVFWSESRSGFENQFLAHLSDPAAKEDPQPLAEAKRTLSALSRGEPAGPIEPEDRFHVLGVAPNAARLAVRLWLFGTVRQFAERIEQHLEDLKLEPAPESPQLSVRRLVNETVHSKGGWPDESAVSPLLAGSVLRSILGGLPYPRALLASVVSRARVEGLADEQTRKDWRSAQHRRCAIIKACLIRNARAAGHLDTEQIKEIPVSLNEDHPHTSYQLGRLFAAMERIQTDALGSNMNSTIKDRYFGSASATPGAVFPRLLRMHQHHIDKLDGGLRVARETLIQEIVGKVETFPAHLNLEGQGLFAIGYYHQRQSFYTKKDEQIAQTVEA